MRISLIKCDNFLSTYNVIKCELYLKGFSNFPKFMGKTTLTFVEEIFNIYRHRVTCYIDEKVCKRNLPNKQGYKY